MTNERMEHAAEIADDPLELLTIEDGWNIDSPMAAEWALHKIKQARAQRDRLIEAADGMIEMYEASKETARQKCEETEGYFTEALRCWFETQEKRELKASYAVDLPSGKLTQAKAGTIRFTRDDAALLPYLRKAAPDMIKAKETVDWSALKPHLMEHDGLVVLDTTGEVVDGIAAESCPPEFSVKL